MVSRGGESLVDKAVHVIKHVTSLALPVHGPASLTAVQNALQIFIQTFILTQEPQPNRQPLAKATAGDQVDDRRHKVIYLPHQPLQHHAEWYLRPMLGLPLFYRGQRLLLTGSSSMAHL